MCIYIYAVVEHQVVLFNVHCLYANYSCLCRSFDHPIYMYNIYIAFISNVCLAWIYFSYITTLRTTHTWTLTTHNATQCYREISPHTGIFTVRVHILNGLFAIETKQAPSHQRSSTQSFPMSFEMHSSFGLWPVCRIRTWNCCTHVIGIGSVELNILSIWETLFKFISCSIIHSERERWRRMKEMVKRECAKEQMRLRIDVLLLKYDRDESETQRNVTQHTTCTEYTTLYSSLPVCVCVYACRCCWCCCAYVCTRASCVWVRLRAVV